MHSPFTLPTSRDQADKPRRWHFARCACGARFLTVTRPICDACEYERALQRSRDRYATDPVFREAEKLRKRIEWHNDPYKRERQYRQKRRRSAQRRRQAARGAS